MDQSGALDSLRGEFEALEEGDVFLDWGATGLLPRRTKAALSRWLDRLARLDARESTWIHAEGGALRARLRGQIAERLWVGAEDIAIVESTTAGLNLAASVIPTRPDQNAVLALSDYLAVAMPWRHRAEREGLELRFVPSVEGEIRAADLLAAVDERTAVVSVSTLAWTSGLGVDLEAIASGLHGHEAALIVDAIQSFGVEPMGRPPSRIDFLAGGGHKWLCSPLGAGWLYASPAAIQRFGLPASGFLSARAPRGSWGDFFADPMSRNDEPLNLSPRGRSFEVGGTPSYPGAIGLSEALDLLKPVSAEAFAEILQLRERLALGLEDLGATVYGGPRPARPTAMVVASFPGGAEEEQRVLSALADARVFLSRRSSAGVGGLRFSIHAMNRLEDIERALSVLAGSRGA